MANIPTTNNNPGDLKDPSTGKFMQFASPQEGYAALLNDLHTKQQGAPELGLTPTSTLVDFSKVWAPKSDNNNPAKYAADLANQMGVRPDTPISQLNLGKWADAIARNEGYQGSLSSNTPIPKAEAAPNIPVAGTPNGLPSATGSDALSAAKSVGNFLFPAVKDVYEDIKNGSATGSGKTLLQQGGDVGLSALPFIPGLGEAGDAARAVEGGADAAKSAGLLGKLAGSATAKGAAVGYGAGVASNLSQGQSVGQAITPGVNNVAGGLLGAAAPVALKTLGGLANKFAGVSPQMANDLAQYGAKDTNGFEQYMNAARTRTQTSVAPTVTNVAADEADTAAQKLKQLVTQSGQKVGAANRAAANVPIERAAVGSVGNEFNTRLEDSFGVKVAMDDEGNLTLMNTRRGGVPLSSTEKARILDVAGRLDDMANNGNVRMADDLMTTLDKKIDYGTAQDPLEGLFSQTRGDVNEAARKASPEFAAANDEHSENVRLLQETQKMAGKEGQRGELLMQRAMQGNMGQDVRNLFSRIKAKTGIDLQKSAIFAKYATDAFGNENDKSALEKMITGAVSGGTHGGIVAGITHAAGATAKRIANPESIGKKIVSGKAGLLGSYLTKTAIEASRGAKTLSKGLVP